MPHEILQLGPWELSVAVLCMMHGLSAMERESRSIGDKSPLGIVPVYAVGGT